MYYPSKHVSMTNLKLSVVFHYCFLHHLVLLGPIYLLKQSVSLPSCIDMMFHWSAVDTDSKSVSCSLQFDQITRCWCEHWEEFLCSGHGPPLSPCSSAPDESYLDQTPQAQSLPHCSGTHAGGWMVWKWAWSWSWLLCRKRRSPLHICPMGKGKLQGETHSPKESHPAGRRCEPGRWRRSAQL